MSRDRPDGGVAAVLGESAATKRRLADDTETIDLIERVGIELAETLERGDRVVLFGNGGSAADAQHVAAELSGRFRRDREPLPAIAVTANSSAVTAIANDYGYETVFARQVRGIVTDGDAAVGISTSGRSANVLRGLAAADERGATTVGLTGRDGGELPDVADHTIRVPSADTARIQEAHIAVGHVLCRIVEERLYE